MKAFLTFIVVVIIILPLFILLNPFIWGMRRIATYEPSVVTSNLIDSLNRKSNLDIYVDTYLDTVWYFRDIRYGKVDKLANFNLGFRNSEQKTIDTNQIKNYVTAFSQKFEHKKYFDSILVTSDNSIIYQIKMK